MFLSQKILKLNQYINHVFVQSMWNHLGHKLGYESCFPILFAGCGEVKMLEGTDMMALPFTPIYLLFMILIEFIFEENNKRMMTSGSS